MTSEEATTLFRMRCVWGDSYRVELAHGIWRGYARDNATTVLTADTAEDLAAQMQRDSASAR